MPASARTLLTEWKLVADDGSVVPVTVPGTVTQAFPDALDADSRTWTFRTVLADVPAGRCDLVLDGVATSYEVRLDDRLLAVGRSMFSSMRLDVTGAATPGARLEVRCLPLATALPPGKARRSRWRTRLVADDSLRLIRTTLLGRCPGIAPGPPVVGPWRPIALEAQPAYDVRLLTRTEGRTGVLTASCSDPTATVSCAGVVGPPGELRIPDVPLWWPHTHGEPVLHDVELTLDGQRHHVGRVGFRSVVNADPTSIDLVVNGVPVWARGAVWTPPGLLAGRPEPPYATVLAARDAGMNLLRVPGTAPYEDAAFLEACDELGVMVWHDLALANLDVPHDLLGDQLHDELADLLDRASGRPCLVVVCGGSEVAQQVAMLGLDPQSWRSEFLDVLAPAAVAGQAVWVGNSPVGGALPFRNDTGIAHYFGVGGYRRPLSDVRAAGVRFAAECLAFANPAGSATWVPRDVGADASFADVREHYAKALDRPSTAVVGELMELVFGEWRREGSPNRGGLVLWLRDLQPGHGWGVLDVDGRPKDPWWHLRRALSPRAVWLTDEGMDGARVHLANDRQAVWAGNLRLATYREDDLLLDEVSVPIAVPGHGSWDADVEGLLGRFVDLTWSYRFGPPSVAVLVATVEDGTVEDGTVADGTVADGTVEDGTVEVGTGAGPQAFLFPTGRPTSVHGSDVLTVERAGDELVLTSDRLLDGVVVTCSGRPSDSSFCLEPRRPRRITGVEGRALLTSPQLRHPVDVASARPPQAT